MSEDSTTPQIPLAIDANARFLDILSREPGSDSRGEVGDAFDQALILFQNEVLDEGYAQALGGLYGHRITALDNATESKMFAIRDKIHGIGSRLVALRKQKLHLTAQSTQDGLIVANGTLEVNSSVRQRANSMLASVITAANSEAAAASRVVAEPILAIRNQIIADLSRTLHDHSTLPLSQEPPETRMGNALQAVELALDTVLHDGLKRMDNEFDRGVAGVSRTFGKGDVNFASAAGQLAGTDSSSQRALPGPTPPKNGLMRLVGRFLRDDLKQ